MIFTELYPFVVDFPEEMGFSDNIESLMQQLLQQTTILLKSSELFWSHIESGSATLTVSSHARTGFIPYQTAIMDIPCESEEQLFEFIASAERYDAIDPVSPAIALSLLKTIRILV